MKTKVNIYTFSLIGVLVILLAAVACQSTPAPSNATWQASSGRDPDASVRGTVVYREQLTLTDLPPVIIPDETSHLSPSW